MVLPLVPASKVTVPLLGEKVPLLVQLPAMVKDWVSSAIRMPLEVIVTLPFTSRIELFVKAVNVSEFAEPELPIVRVSPTVVVPEANVYVTAVPPSEVVPTPRLL